MEHQRAIASKIINNDGVSRDRLSAMPDDVIDHILNCLSLPDVIRTKVLSKKWIHCWKRYGKLDFGEDFFHKYQVWLKHGFVGIVDPIVSQVSGPVYELNLYLAGVIPPCETEDIGRWIQKVHNDVKDLTICGQNQYGCRTAIPSYIYKCSSLQILKLDSCELGSSRDFQGFPKLATLDIDDCVIPETEWEILIGSPLLQHLRLRCADDDGPFLVGSPQLKSLVVEFDDVEVSLRASPNLTEASIMTRLVLPEFHQRVCPLDQFACLLPSIKKLVLYDITLCSLASDSLPLRLPTTLRNLEHLEVLLLDLDSLDQISSTFCLIRSSPNLQSLIITIGTSFYENEDDGVPNFLRSQRIEGNLSGVRNITFMNLAGYTFEIAFVRTILVSCPKLESIQVEPIPYVYKGNRPFLTKLKRLHKLLVISPDPYPQPEA